MYNDDLKATCLSLTQTYNAMSQAHKSSDIHAFNSHSAIFKLLLEQLKHLNALDTTSQVCHKENEQRELECTKREKDIKQREENLRNREGHLEAIVKKYYTFTPLPDYQPKIHSEVSVNVGGTTFWVPGDLLSQHKESRLAQIIPGETDEIIERNPDYFAYVLDAFYKMSMKEPISPLPFDCSVFDIEDEFIFWGFPVPNELFSTLPEEFQERVEDWFSPNDLALLYRGAKNEVNEGVYKNNSYKYTLAFYRKEAGYLYGSFNSNSLDPCCLERRLQYFGSFMFAVTGSKGLYTLPCRCLKSRDVHSEFPRWMLSRNMHSVLAQIIAFLSSASALSCWQRLFGNHWYTVKNDPFVAIYIYGINEAKVLEQEDFFLRK